jgi:O-antigen ligase
MSLRPLRLEAAVVTLVPLTILLFSFGSSSIPSLQRIGVHWRWVGLIALAVVGAFAVLRRAPAARLPPAFVLLGVLVGLGVVSAAWSVDGHLTLERTFTIAALFTAGYGIATLGNRPQAAARMILGSVLVGAVAVALASLVAVVFVRHEAIQPATDGAGWRFQGVGQNPNTVPMLLAVTYPLALGGVLSTRGRKRWLLGAAFLLMAGEVSVSGSRGALIAGTAGAIVVAVALGGTWRRRGILVAAMLVLAAACVGANKLQGSPAPVVATGATGGGQVQRTRGIDGETVFRLEDELGHPALGAYRPPVPRTFLGSSGRAQAWVGAFKQGAQRPVDGYGFGMEEKVFVDRFYAFEGGFVENSYLSMFLQLGAIGVAAFIGLILFLGRDGLRACRASSIETRAPAAAAAGALLAGVTVGMTQSGLLAVGNIASVGLWLSVLCLPTLARTARR